MVLLTLLYNILISLEIVIIRETSLKIKTVDYFKRLSIPLVIYKTLCQCEKRSRDSSENRSHRQSLLLEISLLEISSN